MSITETTGLLTIVASLVVPYLTEAVKVRFGRKAQAQDEVHKTHAELRADLDAERAENARLKAALGAAEARAFQLQKENLELLRQNVNLDTDLKAVLKGGLSKP